MLSETIKTIGITGATGFIGQELSDTLAKAGYSIVVLGRKKPDAASGAAFRFFDLETPGIITAELFKGIDVLIHTAWIYEKRMIPEHSMNLIAAKRMVTAARETGVQRLIFFSSMAADEKAMSFYGQTKRIAESYFDPGKDLILKPGFVIGNGGLGGRLISFAQTKKIIPLVNGGKQPLHCIRVNALCAAVLKCITEQKQGTYLLGDPEPVTYRQFFETVAGVYQRKIRFVSMPSGLLRMLIKTARLLGITLPVTEENLDGLLSLRKLDTAADFSELALPQTTLTDMLKKLS